MTKTAKIAIVVALVILVSVVLALELNKRSPTTSLGDKASDRGTGRTKSVQGPPQTNTKSLPRLVDLGAGKCIPCKLMAPILKELKTEYAGILQVDVFDVSKDPDVARKYGIRLIPTQIFYDSSGKELFRHEGFISKEDILAKWKQLGVDLTQKPAEFSRWKPLVPDRRPPGSACTMCDGNVKPRTRTIIRANSGDIVLCSPHCFFIFYSSLLDTTGVVGRLTATDWASGKALAAEKTFYLYGLDEKARPTIKAFAGRDDALAEMRTSGGSVVDWATLCSKELAVRCAFCDRAVYPEDACRVKVNGMYNWSCCPMCGLGVAVRLQKDIELEVKDALTGEIVRVRTLSGGISSLEPNTAVAWAGKKKTDDGSIVSAGCFKQAFFTSEEHLEKWLEQHPLATGQMVKVTQALAAKMKLTPQQIRGACKIGECDVN